MRFVGYHCDGCGRDLGPEEAVYRCPSCGENLSVRPDFASVTRAQIEASRDPSLWRYAPLLPVAVPGAESGPLASVGGTPLYDAPRAAARFGVARVSLKDEGRMPTGSLKDRASAVVVQRAREIGDVPIITASTGNAGVALAAMARAAGREAVILVPESAPPAKIAQLMIYGARLALVRGSYDDAFALSEVAARELGWYCRNTGQNPFTLEGKKTAAFEIAEQLGWQVPDRVFVSVGDGNIISAVHKGFRELLQLGWIERIPKLMGVQAAGSSPIYAAFASGSRAIEEVQAHTLADSISAGRPSDGRRALAAARDSGGAMLSVSDDAILSAIASLGRDAAVFAEPAAAAAYAGLEQAASQGRLDESEHVLVLITGTGLKDVGAATRAAGAKPPIIEPELGALQRALEL